MNMDHIRAVKDSLTWSIYINTDSNYKDWDENLYTVAPSGEFILTTNMPDYRQDNFDSRVWNSKLRVTVTDHQIDRESAMLAAAELMAACGYYGTFIEGFDYSEDDNKFHLSMGS